MRLISSAPSAAGQIVNSSMAFVSFPRYAQLLYGVPTMISQRPLSGNGTILASPAGCPST